MSTQTATPRYAGAAIMLHWLIAIGLVAMILLGGNMFDADHRPIAWMFQLHKSIGITVLTLMIARFAWRRMNPPPALPRETKPLEKRASHITHIGLYAVVFIMPVTGWILVSASPFAVATVLFGTVPWPHLPILPELAIETREAIYPIFANVHGALSWVLIALTVLHVAGAIKHEFSDEEGVMKRMIPGFFGKTTAPDVPPRSALVAFGAAALFFGAIACAPIVANAVSGAPASPSSSVEAGNWEVDYSNSEIRFSGVHDEDPFDGIFEAWTADIKFAENALEDSQVEVVVETGSARTGNTQYDTTLTAGEWFATRISPQATVSLSGFSSDGETFAANAAITIKEITATVPFVFTLVSRENTVFMSGSTVLSRSALDLGQDSDEEAEWVSNEIRVDIKLQASPKS